MAINAVTSSMGALQQQVAAERQPDMQTDNRPRQDAVARARAANESQNAAPPERPERPERAERPETPKPVVNAQGQKTGTIINTTA